jgi:hypothetical protein
VANFAGDGLVESRRGGWRQQGSRWSVCGSAPLLLPSQIWPEGAATPLSPLTSLLFDLAEEDEAGGGAATTEGRVVRGGPFPP